MLDQVGLYGRNQLEKCNQRNHESWRTAKKSHPGGGGFSRSRILFWLQLAGLQPGGEIHGVNHVGVPDLEGLELALPHLQAEGLPGGDADDPDSLGAADVGLPSSELLDDSLCCFTEIGMGGNTGAPQPTPYMPWRPAYNGVLRPQFAPVEL
jgi:hypothetical protein